MNRFLDEILENDKVRQLINEAICHKEAQEWAEKVINGCKENPEDSMLQILTLAYMTDYAFKKNAERGIPEEITVKTLKDVNVWFDNYESQFKKTGLKEFCWLRYHYTADLFHIGRLQFRLEKSLEGIPSGEYAIETHIPQGQPLRYDECLESFKEATAFFDKYFPEIKADYFMCDSWLLSPELQNILNPETNIAKFNSLWTVIPFVKDNSAQAIERVFGFGFKRAELENAPEETSLQRAVKAHLISGKELDLAAGYIKIER